MTSRLAGRVALITGAAGGVGGGTARRFAAEGASLVITDIDGIALDSLADELTTAGAAVTAISCDIGDPSQIASVVDGTIEQYGKVDILANIAQGGLGEHALLEDATGDEALSAYRTGPLQSLLFMQQCLPHMRNRHHGRIINTASHAAVNPHPGFSTYAMAKGAVLSLTRVASQEWGQHGITTNTVLPVARTGGFDLTEQGRRAAEQVAAASPLGRFGTPHDDIAPLLVFLASDESGYINGQAIGADGGITLIA